MEGDGAQQEAPLVGFLFGNVEKGKVDADYLDEVRRRLGAEGRRAFGDGASQAPLLS